MSVNPCCPAGETARVPGVAALHERWCPEAIAWTEYDAVAERLAREGKTGSVGTELPALMNARTIEFINADPEAFESRVRQFAYAVAMEGVMSEDE